MASQGYTQSWVPYDNNKDCSQGFCSLYCPQWCYFIFSPPPPFEFPDDNSYPSFSPLVIVIMGILASAFLFVSYYTLVSKYCGNTDSLRRRANQEPGEEFEENHSQMHQEPWQATTMGLDETLIKSIAVCKYKKGDGLVEGTDCSVCLNEFEDDESLRLLPKCSHAFHLPCIDTWLKFHSTCPLCRANIVSTSPLSLQLPPSVPENHLDNRPSPESRFENDTLAVIEDLERGIVEETIVAGDVPKTPLGAPSDSGDLKERDTVIDIREERTQPIRRSVSMDFSCQGHVSIADILGIYRDEDPQMEDLRFPAVVGSSKDHEGEYSKSNSRSRVLHCVMSPTAMKRSFSSGRFLFTKYGRGRNSIIPL